jgi:hypothetical protein
MLNKSLLFLLVVLFAPSVYAGVFSVPSEDYSFKINLDSSHLSPEITLEKITSLCTDLTCVITRGNFSSEEWENIYIASSYNQNVSLLFEYYSVRFSENDSSKTLALSTILPYSLDDSCERIGDKNDKDNFLYSSSCTTTPLPPFSEDYNWKDSVSLDLINLKNLGILNLSDLEIEKISSMASARAEVSYFKETWFQTDCANVSKEAIELGYSLDSCRALASSNQGISSFVIPQKNFFNLSEDFVHSSELSSGKNVYYLITGLIFLIILFSYLFRNKIFN